MTPCLLVLPIFIGLITSIRVPSLELENRTPLLFDRLIGERLYFPAGALSSDKKMDLGKAEWYSQELKFLKEPSLWEISQAEPTVEAYRFTWLRSFHAPICVRLTIQRDGSGLLTAKEGTVHGVTESGKLMWLKTKVIPRDRSEMLKGYLESIHFWDFRRPNTDLGGADGSEWIMEGTRYGKYEVIDVWSPAATDPICLLGKMLLFDFAQIKIPPNLVY